MRKIVRSFRKVAPRKSSAAPRKSSAARRRSRAAPRKLDSALRKLGAAPRKLDGAKFAELTTKQPEALVRMQEEIYDLIEQANRDWLARVEKERDLASEFVTRLSSAKCIPDIASACQDSFMRRVEMIAEDGRNLLANSQRFMSAGARALSRPHM